MSATEQPPVFFSALHLADRIWPEQPTVSFEERVAAAASVGAVGTGVNSYELTALLATRTHADLRAVAEHHGLPIGEVELALGWYVSGDDLGFGTEAAVFDHAERLGATRVKTVANIIPPAESPTPEQAVERFAALCDRAAERGLTIGLEPVGLDPTFTHADAAEVVRLADRPNGGLVLDAWHVFRDPTGLSTLEAVDGRHIVSVEICDAHAVPQGENIQDDCLNHRLLPGEGELDLVRFARLLWAKGVRMPVSLEVLNTELRTLSPKENAERSVAALRALVTRAAGQ
ncbi:hypothetical protein Val02_17820 [Virgisporangium aliadipatigenens]|uniref:Xylose isomerase-like TIM barrel domain-containing protein n=1 Tax=Virgisporangium aliadipatigenens TaxID=741659 RepID=A0A8J3YGY5_9ACTN|nr:sugar phosphate isomerase/epimerase family protein [Virgisporangium aliadipatigenens]GIJ44896.1 hypothetical protein Val02_17820 [Virgisporangium aliadipatigenens]